MRWAVVTASLLTALWMGTAQTAFAQDPPPPPPPPPEPARAVPRAERARPTPERVAERQQQVTRDPDAAREAPPARVRETQSPERTGAVRRETVRDASPREARTEGAVQRAPANALNDTPAAAAAPASASASSDQQTGQRPGAVRRPPTDSRGGAVNPRDRAVVRTSPPRDPDHDRDYVYVYPDYWSYGHYDPYYYGLGDLAYSPWGWTPAFYGYPYGYAGYGGGYYQAQGYDIGRVKLKVKPRDAEVFVDGYYAGTIDDFDGMMQSLRLDSGGYRIEIRKPGFETLQFDVRVQPDRTITYRSEMRPTP